jgi:hypothetical protein
MLFCVKARLERLGELVDIFSCNRHGRGLCDFRRPTDSIVKQRAGGNGPTFLTMINSIRSRPD